MKLNTIARTIAAVILSLGALVAGTTAATAGEPDESFFPPYCARR